MLRRQVVPAAKPGRDDFRSYSRVRRLISGCDRNLPADFRIWVHLDIVPLFGEAIPYHFGQLFGR